MTDPGHSVFEGGFVAALGSHVQEVVGAEQDIEAAAVARVGVKDFAGGNVFVEDAKAGGFFTRKFHQVVVVIHFAVDAIFRRERDVVVKIETVGVGGDPRKAPTHA